ncbi:ORF5 [Halorubrum pleomorphic virus 1]|uniref:Uncharacterized protein 5 n=1 Tax=Halorubrum pleomorphic virus 1 TaxID=634168 RepID=ORF5_HAPV1|nr:hypothetical protein HRPV-1_gp5 [Halorubrum pleomorphic virus 1]C1JJY4.1 RecName: Full=Uncharacterized protein 5 [Halorubrum pleomorphic virus 1]ACO54900.1 ORF5 [Halorubrum pleomorphic virus 1]
MIQSLLLDLLPIRSFVMLALVVVGLQLVGVDVIGPAIDMARNFMLDTFSVSDLGSLV